MFRKDFGTIKLFSNSESLDRPFLLWLHLSFIKHILFSLIEIWQINEKISLFGTQNGQLKELHSLKRYKVQLQSWVNGERTMNEWCANATRTVRKCWADFVKRLMNDERWLHCEREWSAKLMVTALWTRMERGVDVERTVNLKWRVYS